VNDVALSDAEATLLAGMAGVDQFPAALPPDLDDAGWATAARGLLARGLAHGERRLVMSEEVAGLVGGVVFAERSLWIRMHYRPGEGDNLAQVLWIRGDEVVRHILDPEARVHHLCRCAGSPVDELLATAFDFPTAERSCAGEPRRLSQRDFVAALELREAEGRRPVAERYPAATDYADAMYDGRRSTCVKLRGGPGDEAFPWREREFVEAPSGLWLMHYETPGDPPPDGSGTVVLQRISVDTARELMVGLAEAT
jgi:hypothetical protein